MTSADANQPHAGTAATGLEEGSGQRQIQGVAIVTTSPTVTSRPAKVTGSAASSLRPALAFLRLEILRVVRNRRYLLLTIGFPLFFYLMYTRILPASGLGWIDGMPWSAYFMIGMGVFGSVGASFSVGGQRLSAERASGWTRQLRITPLSPAAYVLAKVATALIVTLPALLVIALAGVAADGVTLAPGSWLTVVVLLWVGSLPIAALGLALGLLLDADTAQPGVTATYIGLAFLGGLFQPAQSMPSALQQLAHALPLFHLADLGWRAAAGRSLDPDDLLILLGYAIVLFATVAWLYRRDTSQEHG